MQNTEHTMVLRVLIIQQDGLYAAQCIDHDIVAQGNSIPEAKKAFERTIISQVVSDLMGGRKPLAAFPPAPDKLRQLFEHAEKLADVKPITLPEGMPPAYICNQIPKDIRVW
jgi:hypothetical protein